jgi:uncharacterized protein
VHEPDATLALWDYRRRVAELYRDVRHSTEDEDAWRRWRAGRDELFADHPQSPLTPEQRETFEGSPFFAHDAAWSVEGRVEPLEGVTVSLGHSADGETSFRLFGRVRFSVEGREHTLDLFWLDRYGGGLFLPFRDTTSGEETYSGGRYLLDTAKGADLGGAGRTIALDFNFAYHPSCVYSPDWSCPLAPPGNTLEVPVRVGERLPT